MPVCTQCGRETKAAKDTCLYCGGAMAVETKTQLNCPRCATAMRRDMVDGIELDLCDGCGGTWYDRGELEQHVAAGDPAPDDGPGQQPNREFHREADKLDTRYLKCPICASMMTRKNWSRLSGIIIDICGPHGLFIDAGEFERIRDFEGSGTKARADRLVSWEQARDQKERSRKEAQVRQDLHREIRKSRGFWRQF